MAADAFARPSSPNSFSFNDEMSSPGGANDMTRLPPENVKSMEEMQNEVEVLRKRLKRRNVLLDEVRRAYLNDVVTVKEEILRDTKHRHEAVRRAQEAAQRAANSFSACRPFLEVRLARAHSLSKARDDRLRSSPARRPTHRA